MSASFRKLYRELHREVRLTEIRMGENSPVEVRPLSLTPDDPKIITIKDKTLPNSKDESKPEFKR